MNTMSGNDERRNVIPICPICGQDAAWFILVKNSRKDAYFNTDKRKAEKFGEFNIRLSREDRMDKEKIKQRIFQILNNAALMWCKNCYYTNNGTLFKKTCEALEFDIRRYPRGPNDYIEWRDG